MPNIHNSGDTKPYFKSRLGKQQKNSSFFAHEQARYIYNTLSLNSRYCGGWQKALDRKDIRVLTKGKVPQRKNWPNCYEKLRIEELLRKYEEWGARTGKRVGNKWYVIVDLDLENFPASLWKHLEKNYLLMKGRQKIKHIKTRRGYHDILLLDELPPNGAIYHTDKFGTRRKIGDILSLGRQAQALGSPDKEPAGKGKWAWQAKNIQEVSKVWKKYFLEIECKENNKISTKKTEQKEINNLNKKLSKNISPNVYTKIKLEKIRITSKQATKRVNHYRVNYCDQQKRRGFFFLDSYFRDKRERIQPNLIGNFLLMRGYKYQFYLRSF